MITSLLDQGHLCPLPLSSRPILWEYDNALRVYPLPDVIVLVRAHEIDASGMAFSASVSHSRGVLPLSRCRSTSDLSLHLTLAPEEVEPRLDP